MLLCLVLLTPGSEEVQTRQESQAHMSFVRRVNQGTSSTGCNKCVYFVASISVKLRSDNRRCRLLFEELQITPQSAVWRSQIS